MMSKEVCRGRYERECWVTRPQEKEAAGGDHSNFGVVVFMYTYRQQLYSGNNFIIDSAK